MRRKKQSGRSSRPRKYAVRRRVRGIRVKGKKLLLRPLKRRLKLNKQANSSKNWTYIAYEEGAREALLNPMHEEVDKKKAINRIWSNWFLSNDKKMSWAMYHHAAYSFLQGFCKKAGMAVPDWVLVPSLKTVGIIITVMNEEETLSSVVAQLRRLSLNEIIVVVNGSSDNSFPLLRSLTQSIIIHYPQALGHDVGRAVGAKVAQSDILVFLDGDFPIHAEHLVPFIYAVQGGMDVALNNISPYLGHFTSRDSVTVMKEFVNRTMGRQDLSSNSLTAVPHALSRTAVKAIGYKNLYIPPVAQVIAIQQGLTIGAPLSVDVITKNKIRTKNTGLSNPVANMIIGDHLEALKLAMSTGGQRLSFQDRIRSRSLGGMNEH
jgi:hypothetical protein